MYDANRRLTAVVFADGARNEFGYDARGNRTLEKSPAHERGLAYDELGRLVRVEDRTLGRIIEYGYDAAGQRRRMTVDTGEAVRYGWDAAGRLVETFDAQGQATRFAYDAAGRRTGATYENGTRATWAYDAAGQVTSIAYLDRSEAVQTAFSYTYHGAGNRTQKAFVDGTRESYGYDPLNRLTSVDYGDGRHVEYVYDAVGNRRELLDASRTVTRWAASAAASSFWAMYGPPANAAGAPDAQAWSPDRKNGQPEWLEVTYTKAERARGVRIHEAKKAPFVMRVDLIEANGTSHTVYEGGDTTSDGGWLELRFPVTAYAVKKARVWTATPSVGAGAGEQLDAVGLVVPNVERYEYNGFNQLLTVTAADGSKTAFGYDGNGNPDLLT